MRILAIDDELHARRTLVSALHEAAPEAEVVEFALPSEMLAYAEEHPFDAAFLDINLRGMGGMELAARLKRLNPKVNLVFVTGYSEFTGEAIAMHASGYIMKPVTAEQVRRELDDLRYSPETPEEGRRALLHLHCFGNFDVSDAEGRPVRFERSKAKELLAYLTFRRGAACTTREVAGLLFEDLVYDDRQQSYVQQIISALLHGLRRVGAERAVIRSYNSLALDVSLVDCDYYRFEAGEREARSLYAGEFMAQYSWAEGVTAFLDRAAGLLG